MGKPPPYVMSVGKRFIRLKVPRTRNWQIARNLGAEYRWFPPAFGLSFVNETDIPGIFASLRDAGFVFLRTGAWDSPAAMMEEYVSRSLVSPGFTILEIADKEHWTTTKNEKRPATRPFFAKK